MSAADATGFIDISGDGGILKKIIAEGKGDCPQIGRYEIDIVSLMKGIEEGSTLRPLRVLPQTLRFSGIFLE